LQNLKIRKHSNESRRYCDNSNTVTGLHYGRL
jgi:hypothetical protein